MLRFPSAPLLAAFFILLSGSAARADGRLAEDVPCAALPSNLRPSALLRPVIMQLLERSPTIRRQCAAIAAAPHVGVTIRHALRRLDHCARATATMRRLATGELEVTIELPFGPDYAELLAHELEHVLEQIDGVDLKRQSRTRSSGVAEVASNVFETERAKHAGLSARREARFPIRGRHSEVAGFSGSAVGPSEARADGPDLASVPR